MVHDFIVSKKRSGKKMVALLIDPDKCSGDYLEQFISLVKQHPPDLLLVGGSLVNMPFEPVIDKLKSELEIPVILYPGNPNHLTPNVDAVLFLSLISGRNPDLLIGSHVVAAPFIRRHKIEPIATGYMLVDGGSHTSVGYMSQTSPIPASKNDIAVATAMAGEMLGMKLIYLDAGSGATTPVTPSMIASVRASVDIPLMVGGGISSPRNMKIAFDAGADIVVIGNAIEKNHDLIPGFVQTARGY